MLSLTRNKFIKTVIETVSLSWSCRRNQTEHSLARLFRGELSSKLFETKLKSLFLLSRVKCAAATTFATNNGSEKSIFTIWFDFVALFSKIIMIGWTFFPPKYQLETFHWIYFTAHFFPLILSNNDDNEQPFDFRSSARNRAQEQVRKVNRI